MRSFPNIKAGVATVLLMSLVMVLAGCATMGKTWDPRVGHYTYEQAVVELGPPDKQERLGDGTLVAEWLTQQSRVYYHADYGAIGYPYYYGTYIPNYTVSQSPAYFLRLIFGADNRLQSWKQVTK